MRTLIGLKVKGFGGGYFGRNSYDDRTIEDYGLDWIITRNDDGVAEAVVFENRQEMLAFIDRYATKGSTCYD